MTHDPFLAELQAEAARAAERRRVIRRASGVLGVAVIALALLPLLSRPASPPASPVTAPVPHDARIVRHTADVSRYQISDDELLAALEETQQPHTIMWVGGEPVILDSADDEPAEPVSL